MYTAMLTIANMRGATHDVWAVNTDFEYHEEQRLDVRDPLAAEASLPDHGTSPDHAAHPTPDGGAGRRPTPDRGTTPMAGAR